MKNRGSSLLYVLIILSVLSVFLTNFILFTKNRHKLLKLNSVYSYDLKKKLIEQETAFSGSLYKSGLFFTNYRVKLNNKFEYYNSGITKNHSGKTVIKRLIYSDKNQESTGGFKIITIKDKNSSIYYPPLNENTVYPDLIIIYEKIILNKSISVIENIKFSRKNSNEINVETDNFYFEEE